MNKKSPTEKNQLIHKIDQVGQRLAVAHGAYGSAVNAEAEAKAILKEARQRTLVAGVKGANKEQRDAAVEAAVAVQLKQHQEKTAALVVARTQLEQAKIQFRILERQLEALQIDPIFFSEAYNQQFEN